MALIPKTPLAAAFLLLIASLLGANAAWGEAMPDMKPPSSKAAAELFFVGQPDIECEEGPVEGVPRMCRFRAHVRNGGSKTAQHAYIMCVTRHSDTGKLAQLTWRRISFGALQPTHEKEVTVPYQEPEMPERERRHEYKALWKNRRFPNALAERLEIAEKVVIRDKAKAGETSVRILGFIVNSGENSGFAPRLTAKVMNENGELIHATSAHSPQLPLDPGDKLPFIIILPAIEEDLLDNIRLEFESAD